LLPLAWGEGFGAPIASTWWGHAMALMPLKGGMGPQRVNRMLLCLGCRWSRHTRWARTRSSIYAYCVSDGWGGPLLPLPPLRWSLRWARWGWLSGVIIGLFKDRTKGKRVDWNRSQTTQGRSPTKAPAEYDFGLASLHKHVDHSIRIDAYIDILLLCGDAN
jgi:hypothetical protein